MTGCVKDLFAFSVPVMRLCRHDLATKKMPKG